MNLNINKNNPLLVGVLAMLFGMIFMGVVTFIVMPELMLLEDVSPHDFDTTVDLFVNSVDEHGWKIATVHDLQETMKKFDKDVARVTVFEICHPEYAYRILSQNDERIVSALMPCRVSIYEKEDGKVYVSRMNSGLMGMMMKGVVPEVMGIASEESEMIIQKVLN